jgi:MYXO-CTERM domain-containing protein
MSSEKTECWKFPRMRAATVTPEPGAISLLALGWLALGRRRRRV